MGLTSELRDNAGEVNDIYANVSKEDGIKLSKFSVLVDDIADIILGYSSLNDFFYDYCGGTYGDIIDPSLIFIFDYDKLNEYGKIILNKAPISTEWCVLALSENEGATKYADIKDAIYKTKEFIAECRKEEYDNERYKFIFWSLMILAVDKSDEDEHISLICNFAKMLNITDKEIADMIYVVKLIFNKVDDIYEFQSNKVVEIFGEVINKYSFEY